MIHEIAKEVGALLRARGCPLPVLDGTEQSTSTTYARERIVFEHDEDAGDVFTPIKGTNVNPSPRAVVEQGFKATIYAQSTRAGAFPFEHRRRAEIARDFILCALIEVAADRNNVLAFKGGRFVQPDGLDKSKTIGGAKYELKFTFDRGVRVIDWDGGKRPEAEVGPGGVVIKNTTKAHLVGSDDPPETACG